MDKESANTIKLPCVNIEPHKLILEFDSKCNIVSMKSVSETTTYLVKVEIKGLFEIYMDSPNSEDNSDIQILYETKNIIRNYRVMVREDETLEDLVKFNVSCTSGMKKLENYRILSQVQIPNCPGCYYDECGQQAHMLHNECLHNSAECSLQSTPQNSQNVD